MLLKLGQKRIIIITGLIVSFGILIYFSRSPITECLSVPQSFTQIPIPYENFMSIPIGLEITPTQPSLLSRKIELKIRVLPLIDTKDFITHVIIDLPKQLQLVVGQTSWVGHLSKNEEKILFFTVQATESGEWEIIAKAKLVGEDGRGYGRTTKAIVKSTLFCITVQPPENLYKKIPKQVPNLKIKPPAIYNPDSSYNPKNKRTNP